MRDRLPLAARAGGKCGAVRQTGWLEKLVLSREYLCVRRCCPSVRRHFHCPSPVRERDEYTSGWPANKSNKLAAVHVSICVR